MTTPMAERIAELTRSRVPFVQATVVRAQEPSSARPGDRAIILADGSMEGFVGGQCAAGSVRTAALDALGAGASVLLRVTPDGEESFPSSPGASVVVNPCLSGGALEIYLEPLLPDPILHVVGNSPVAASLAELGTPLGFVVEPDADDGMPAGATAVVVCTHGGDEAGAVRAALDAGIGFVGVVCSHTRADALLAQLELTEEERNRVHPHVGIDIGARTAPEIALSILAAVVRAVRVEGLAAPTGGAASRAHGQHATDPVCGMSVTVGPETVRATIGGVQYWFCGPGCRDRYVAAPAS